MIKDYSQFAIDDNLNSVDSLLNVVESGDKLNFLDSLEAPLSEMIENGVIGGVNKTLGVEVGAIKTSNLSYLQSKNYVADTTGWRFDSAGNVYAVGGKIGGTTLSTTALTSGTVQTATSGQRVVLDGSANVIRFYDTNGVESGTIYGLDSPAGLGITGDIQAGSVSMNLYNLTLNDGAGPAIDFAFSNSVDIGTSSTTLRDLYVNRVRLTNLGSDPSGAAVVGDLVSVSGKLKICTTAGTPGTFTIVGSQS